VSGNRSLASRHMMSSGSVRCQGNTSYPLGARCNIALAPRQLALFGNWSIVVDGSGHAESLQTVNVQIAEHDSAAGLTTP